MYQQEHTEHSSLLRGVPQNVQPFSQGVGRNIADFCWRPAPGEYKMRPLSALRRWSRTETFWENRHYSCC